MQDYRMCHIRYFIGPKQQNHGMLHHRKCKTVSNTSLAVTLTAVCVVIMLAKFIAPMTGNRDDKSGVFSFRLVINLER